MRLLMLGWDGADWDVLDPLLEAGALPHLAGLLARGWRAPLASLEPRLSPLLWTSAITGLTPDRHGVLNFAEPSPDGQGLRLASSTSRRCRALWNLLQLCGLRSHVVNWYATHPAEPINGVVLSNQFFQASEPPAQSLHPVVQHSEWLQARQAAGGAAAATRARILPDPALLRQPEDKALSQALGAAAERAETIHQLSLRADPLAPIPSWVLLSGDAGEHPAEQRLDPFEAHEAVKQLIDLGYLAALPPGQADRVAFVRRETAFNCAVVLARSGRGAEAIPWLEPLVEQQPRQARYALLLVECLLASGDARAALRQAKTFLQRQLLSSAMRLQQLLALLALNQQEEARELLPLIRPGSTTEHLNLAEIHAQLRQPQAAAEHYRAALADAGLAIPAHLGLARLALAAGQGEQAAEHCLDAQALSLQVPEAHLLLALCLAWLEMPQEAALSCGHALALQPHSRPALLLQAGLAGLQGDADVDPLSREQLDGLLAVDLDTARPQERLLPEVLLWIRSRSVPAPLALDRF